MKNKLILIAAFVLLSLSKHGLISTATAQTVSSYSFTQGIYNYVPLTGATVLGSGMQDDVNYNVNIGFTFNYHGSTYTSITLSTNGYAVFGTSNISYTPLVSLPNAIAAMGHDLNGQSTTHQLRYTSNGVVGDHTFTAEWFNWGLYSSGLSEMNFQITLYEQTGAIKITYQPVAPAPTTATTMEAGLTGTTVGDFSTRTSTTNWSASTAGAANSSAMTYSSTIYPANGLTYTWVPSNACSGTPTGGTTVASSNTICSSSAYTVSLSGASTSFGLTYQWQSSPNGTTWTSINGATNNTYTTTSAAGTIYYQCIVTCTGSGSSATSSALQLTVNAGPTMTVTPSSSQTICPGQTVTFTATGASSYLWNTGATTSSITVSAYGNYFVTGTTGACSVTSTPVYVVVNPCSAPTSLTTTNITQHTAVLHWATGICATGFQIYYLGSQYTNWQYVNIGAGATSYTLSNLQNNFNVQWKIRRICSSTSTSGWSATQTIHTLTRMDGDAPTTSTTDALTITAFPNPTDGILTVQLNIFSDESNVTLTNMLGQTVQQFTSNTGDSNGEINLNIADLPQGIYMVFVKDAEGVRSMRIVKE